MIGLSFVTPAAFSRMRSATHLDSMYPLPVTVSGDVIGSSKASPVDVPSYDERQQWQRLNKKGSLWKIPMELTNNNRAGEARYKAKSMRCRSPLIESSKEARAIEKLTGQASEYQT